MKKQIVALMISLMATVAMAGNEGPQAAPPAPSPVIAQVVTSGGMPGPQGSPRSYELVVHASGEVKALTRYDNRTESESLAVLSPEVTKKLVKLIGKVQEGELVLVNPDEEGCYDAPSTTYYAIKNGKKIAVGGDNACREMQNSKATSADYTIQSILSGLRSLKFSL